MVTMAVPEEHCVSPQAKSKYQRLLEKVHRVIEHNIWFVSVIAILIFTNLFLFVIEVEPNFYETYREPIDMLELVSAIVFSIEYAIRLWVCVVDRQYQSPIKGRLRYMASPMAIADLLGVLHFYLPALIPLNVVIFRVFRVFRLFHIVGLPREKESFFEIFEGTEKSKARTGFNLFIAALIILNVLVVFLEFDPVLFGAYEVEFRIFEYFCLFIFTIEYLLRLWVCTLDPQFTHPVQGRLHYMVTPMALVDLITIAPFYLPIFIPFDLFALRVFRLFRLFRALKFTRYRKHPVEGKEEEIPLNSKRNNPCNFG